MVPFPEQNNVLNENQPKEISLLSEGPNSLELPKGPAAKGPNVIYDTYLYLYMWAFSSSYGKNRQTLPVALLPSYAGNDDSMREVNQIAN